MPYLTDKTVNKTGYGRGQTSTQSTTSSDNTTGQSSTGGRTDITDKTTGARRRVQASTTGPRAKTGNSTRTSSKTGSDATSQITQEDKGVIVSFLVPFKKREPIDPAGSADLGCP